MKPVSLAVLMLAAQAVAAPSMFNPLGQAQERGLEGEEYHFITARQNKASSSSTTSSSTTKSGTTTSRVTSTTFASSTTRSSSSSTTTTVVYGKSTVNAEINSRSSTTTTTSKTTSTTSRSSAATTTTSRTTTTTTTTTTKKTTTTTTTSAAAATRTINVTGMTYQNALMSAHNAHRANHSLADLVWNSDLAKIAQDIANNCVYGHNVTADGGGYGQNIGAGAAGNAAAGLITNLMYNGEINYYPLPYGDDNPSLDNFHLWGHYSQLVWDETTDVGCYTKDCSATGLSNTGPGVAPYFTVCNYSPPGNYVGEFSSVAPPGNGQTVVIVGS